MLAVLCAVIVIAVLLLIREAPSTSAQEDRPEISTAAHPPSSRNPASPQEVKPTEPWREPVTRTGVDASNLYKNAFVLFDQLTEEEKKMIRQPREEVDAETAAALFEKIHAIMELLLEAARADYCDWGLASYRFDTPLPHLGKAIDLGKLALWAAAYQFPFDPRAAIEDLTIRSVLGHHVADTFIGVVVEAGFERTATRLLTQHLGSFDAGNLAAASKLIDASTLDKDLERVFQVEATNVETMVKELAARSPAERDRVLDTFGMFDANALEQAAREDIIALLDNPQRLAAEVAFIQKIDLAFADAMKLPEAEFQSWWKGIESEFAIGHPLARKTFPMLAALQPMFQRSRVERTLLSAGLDVLQYGPAQVARYRDPATGKALIYVPTRTGFDLRSTYAVEGKPMTLSFPPPK